jgi:hypothetical protein
MTNQTKKSKTSHELQEDLQKIGEIRVIRG